MPQTTESQHEGGTRMESPCMACTTTTLKRWPTYPWLEKAGRKGSPVNADNGCTRTGPKNKMRLYHTRQEHRCRLCKEPLKQCSKSQHGVTFWKKKHTWNAITGPGFCIIHWNICNGCGLDVLGSRWMTHWKVVWEQTGWYLWDFWSILTMWWLINIRG